MPSDLNAIVRSLSPEQTILLFGAGSSLPSNAPSVSHLQTVFERTFGVPASGYTLAEQTGIIEQQTRDRGLLISTLRAEFERLRPTGSLLNLPLYSWRSIFTTNYDDLIEKSYKRRDREVSVYSSNFDFGRNRSPSSVQLFKLHGKIDKDVVNGDRSRIILTDADYDETEEFRESLYDRLRADLAGGTLFIIGHSLADPDIRAIVNRAAQINARSGGSGRIILMSFSRDDGRAALLEARNMTVTFGGLDEFFAELAKRIDPSANATIAGSADSLDTVTDLRPSTTDAGHASSTRRDDVSAMYNGWPATYADIAAGHTFRRDVSDDIERLYVDGKLTAALVGASGVGKTTAARQVVQSLMSREG